MFDPNGDLIPGSTRHQHTDELCRACDGTGKKRAKPEWSEAEPVDPKEPTQNNITTPKNERPQGTRELRLLLERAGDALNDDLGYTARTPLYYIVHAVLTDWLNSRGA